MTKFVASTVEINKDTDVLTEDVISMGAQGVTYFVDEALDRADGEVVYVVSEDLTMAENMAAVLNAQYEKEMELMKDAKKVIDQAVATKVMEEELSNEAKIASSAAARKFLESRSADIINAKTAPAKEENKNESKEEKEMNTTAKGMGRRRLSAGENTEAQNQTTGKEEKAMNNTEKKDKKAMGSSTGGNTEGRRRLSAGTTSGAESSSKKSMGKRKRRIQHGESATASTFTKFEGPWYMNASLYPVLSRFEDIVDNMADAELGVTDIRVVDPVSIRKYENREDVISVVQMLFGGVVLEFAIKENMYDDSSSDLTSTSIVWKEGRNGMYPAFGFWRGNAPMVKATCKCGAKLEGQATDLYCRTCRKRTELDVVLDGNIEFDLPEYYAQTVPNLTVPRDVLALAMAIAQYAEGFDMYGLVEDGEEA